MKTILDYTPQNDTDSETDDITVDNASTADSRQKQLGERSNNNTSALVGVNDENNMGCVELNHPNSGLESQNSLDVENLSQVLQ